MRLAVARDLEAQTVKMAQGIYIHQGSTIHYREAKLAFVRCALANDPK